MNPLSESGYVQTGLIGSFPPFIYVKSFDWFLCILTYIRQINFFFSLDGLN